MNAKGIWTQINEWGSQPTSIIMMLIFCPPLGIYLLWKYGTQPQSRKILLTVISAVLFIIWLGKFTSCSGTADDPANKEIDPPAITVSDTIVSSEPSTADEAAVTTEPTTAVTTAADEVKPGLAFNIIGNVPGDYGEWITLNAGTDMPNKYIAYRLPVGRYRATNLDPKYPVSLYVYSNETIIDDGWEYPADALPPISLDVDESKGFEVPDGYYLKIIGSDKGTAVHIEQQ